MTDAGVRPLSAEDLPTATDGPATTAGRIAEAALDMFFERGYRATTVRELVLACDLTPGALYNHFVSKDALLLGILQEVHQQLEVMLTGAVDGAGVDPRERLAAYVRAHAIFHTRYRKEARVANAEVLQLEEPGRSQIVASRLRGRRQLEAVLREGDASGAFAVQDVKVMTMAILNMGIRVAEWFRPDGRLSAEEVAEIHAGLALRMVGASPGR